MGLLAKRFNLLVLVAIVACAAILGVLNNFRVYEEQRVPFWGPLYQDEDGDFDD